MKIKKYILSGLFILSISSLIYIEIKETMYLFDGNWSIEKEIHRQEMLQEGLNKEEIKQNLQEKNYNKENYVRG